MIIFLCALLFLVVIAGVHIIWNNKKKIAQLENDRNRYKNQADCLAQWVRNDNRGDVLVSLLQERGIASVAIYGKGIMGRLIYHALAQTDIRVCYFIDMNADRVLGDLAKTITLPQASQEVLPDAIIVSIPHNFIQIKNTILANIEQKVSVFSIEEILFRI